MSTTSESTSHTQRVGVLVVAYNAASTLAWTLSRLPESFARSVDHVLICDDASQDDTAQVGLAWKQTATFPLTVIRHEVNLGYGGNQKHGYQWAIEHGLDVVVLLHADGQYAPEHIESLVEPLLAGQADAVFGSRMLARGAALKGGMPMYKYVGNKILTTIQNRSTGLELSEWHSGYRAYRVDVLKELDLASYSNGFDFDTEIILGLHSLGKKIAEVPIPTYYGDEICYVNGVQYAKDVLVDVASFKAREFGFGTPTPTAATTNYPVKPSPYSSHGRLLHWLSKVPASEVLDVGCWDGQLSAQMRQLGHRVTGIDLVKHDGIGERVDEFFEADLNQELPSELGTFPYIVAGDVLEHVMEPKQLLTGLIEKLRPGGEILISVPNFSHWYPRGRVALGLFDYDQRGPLDVGHLRFFTQKSFHRLLEDCQLRVLESTTVGSPLEAVAREGSRLQRITQKLSMVDRGAVRVRPTLFGYQFLYRVTPQ